MYAITIREREAGQNVEEFKIVLIILLLRNINPKRGLCNGTRLIVRRITRRCIKAEIVVDEFYGQRVFIPRIPLTTAEDGISPVKFCRRQFPIKPAFATTVNKSQGQTLQHLSVYLPQSVIYHGQLYWPYPSALVPTT